MAFGFGFGYGLTAPPQRVPVIVGLAYPGERLASMSGGQWYVGGVPMGGSLQYSLIIPETAEGLDITLIAGGRISKPVTVRTFNGWVATDGNDSNAGTYAAPWLTLSRIVTYAQGATVAATLTLNGTTGNLTATRSVAGFVPGDVGKCIYTTSGIGAAIITSYTSPTVVNVTVISTFSTFTYASGVWAIAEMVDGATSRIRLKAGSYVNQSCNVTRTASSAGQTTKLIVTSESGVAVSWNLGTDQSCFQGAGFNWVFDVAGYGGTISGFNVGTGNAIGATNTMTMIGRGWTITDCVDGLSGHNNVRIEGHDLTISNCSKSAFQHINTVQSFHYRCSFTGKVGASTGIGQLDPAAINYSEDCSYIPTANAMAVSLLGTYVRCKFGTTALSVAFGALDTSAGFIVSDSFINLRGDARMAGLFERCYGKASFRLRGSLVNPDLVFNNCIFVGPGSGGTDGFLYSNTDIDFTWQGNGYTFRDCIFKGYTTAIGGGFSANQFASFNSASTIANCCCFGNTTNIHASITVATGTITGNPLLGAANTTTKTDYGFLAGSPCIGAGTGGNDIGFAA